MANVRYLCSKCNAPYLEEAAADACEASHAEVDEIKEYHYEPRRIYPDRIMVMLSTANNEYEVEYVLGKVSINPSVVV